MVRVEGRGRGKRDEEEEEKGGDRVRQGRLVRLGARRGCERMV
jgi:hypothetical protein